MTTSCAGPDCHAEHLEASQALARLRGVHAGGLHVLEVSFLPRARLAAHEHAHARFSFMLDGGIGESYASGSLCCERDVLAFHPPALAHANEMGAEGARAVMIEVCGDPGEELAALVRALPDPFAASQHRLRDVAVDLSRLLRSEDAVRPILVESLALDLIARSMRFLEGRSRGRQHAVPPAWLDDLIRIVDDRFETHLSLTEVASLLRVTPRQLASALYLHRGMTFVELVRKRRLARAQELLRDSHLPLAEVALASGFSDQSHLTRHFRLAFGVTPARYRRSAE